MRFVHRRNDVDSRGICLLELSKAKAWTKKYRDAYTGFFSSGD